MSEEIDGKNYNLGIGENLAKALRPLIEQQEAIKVTMKPIADALDEISSKLNVDISGFKGMYKLTRDFAKMVDGLGERTKKSIIILLEHGWYIDEDLTPRQMDELANACVDNIKEVEEFLCNHYEAELSRLESSIAEGYPHRASIISTAFKAHRNKEFELSIPIILIQVDGICKEKTDRYFFTRPKGVRRPETSEYAIDVIADISAESIRYAFLIPLMELSPIHFNLRERDDDFNHLNRHLILHGDSCDYNSKVNSYKSISLLNYIVQSFNND